MLLSRAVSPSGRFRPLAPLAASLSGLALLILAALATRVAAQEIPPEELPRVQLLGKGLATLASGEVAAPISWAATPAGPIVDLDPIVARLGGRLEVGPLGQSFTLTLGESTFVMVPGSAAITSGTEIVPLATPPWSVDGRFLVPLELLERTFGSILGVSFSGRRRASDWFSRGRRSATCRSRPPGFISRGSRPSCCSFRSRRDTGWRAPRRVWTCC